MVFANVGRYLLFIHLTVASYSRWKTVSYRYIGNLNLSILLLQKISVIDIAIIAINNSACHLIGVDCLCSLLLTSVEENHYLFISLNMDLSIKLVSSR